MSSSPDNMILGLPRRPRIAEASEGAILGALALGILTGGWAGALLGGLAGGALATQRQPIEMAVRDYFKSKGLEVIFFYPAPRSIKVTFSYDKNAYWTVESVLPDGYQLSPEDTLDWLYGNLITSELPKFQSRLKRAS